MKFSMQIHGFQAKIAQMVSVLFGIFFLSGLFLGCAHIEAPPGGPEDITHPTLSAVFPKPGAVNQSMELDVRLEFSEWVNKTLKQSDIFISPALPRQLKYKVNGKMITVNCASRLDSNTTYIISVKNGIKDLHNLPLEKNFNLIFTTGERLDSLSLKGKIFFPKESKNLIVGLYPVDERRQTLRHLTQPGDKEVDTLPHVGRERPMYLIPADTLGVFTYMGIKPGKYALLAFGDNNNNLRPDLGTEKIAIGEATLTTPFTKTQVFQLDAYDTIPPAFVSALWQGETLDSAGESLKTNGTALVKFSEDMYIPSILKRDNFLVTSADSSDTISITSICLKPGSKQELELFTQALEPESLYLVHCFKGFDQSGNSLDTAKKKAFLKVSDKIDSLPLAIQPLSFNNGDSSVFFMELPEFYINKIITPSLLDTLQNQLLCQSGSDTVLCDLIRKNHHVFSLEISPGKPLPLKGQSIMIEQLLPIPVDTISESSKVTGDTLETDSNAIAYKRDTTVSGADIKESAPDTMDTMLDSIPVKDTADTSIIDSKPGFKKVLLGSFTLPNDSNWGTCEIMQPGDRKPWTVILKHLSWKREFTYGVKPQNRHDIKQVPAGKYLVEYFHDKNINNQWDPGSLAPWSAQEARGNLEDTVVITPGKRTEVEIQWPPDLVPPKKEAP
ncbi:MAG: Ig-like domain-containing protein [Fibrobacteria bacterium]|nr:Ig-like domain-containing protein [Fibrobacteria bacterium]